MTIIAKQVMFWKWKESSWNRYVKETLLWPYSKMNNRICEIWKGMENGNWKIDGSFYGMSYEIIPNDSYGDDNSEGSI